MGGPVLGRRGFLTAVGTLAAGCAAPSESSSGAVGRSSGPGGGVIVEGAQPGSAHGYRGTYLDPPFPLPGGTFTDTSGRPFELARDARWPLTLVFFGYTNCPDVCPTVVADVASALRRMPAGQRGRIGFVLITTDPKLDTPKALRAYLDQFNTSFAGLTGPMPVIKAAADQLKVSIEPPQKQPGGGYTTDHGSHVTGFGPDRKGRVFWTPGTPVADLRHDYARLLTATG
jgi:protein SCO1/2